MIDQLNPQVKELLRDIKKRAKAEGRTIDSILGLEDFSDVLVSEIRDQLAALDEPVFTNPTTGKAASSVFAVFDALDYPRRR